CDVLAGDAMRRPHPALESLELPIVSCDRGFGAAIIREGVTMPGGSPNPIPLIQIPYARLKEMHNLTSILHEAGHQALSRLGLVRPLALAIARRLNRRNADARLIQLFALWSRELGPDFWGICLSGVAQAATLRDIMSLPARQAFHVAWMDPHPPPFLRTLWGFEACRQLWGQGVWDRWETEWLETYPVDRLSESHRSLLVDARRVLPLTVETMIHDRFASLDGRA